MCFIWLAWKFLLREAYDLEFFFLKAIIQKKNKILICTRIFSSYVILNRWHFIPSMDITSTDITSMEMMSQFKVT